MELPGSVTGNVVAPRTHTTQPILTGTSVLAIKYKDGVMMSSDTLASYGGLARFTDVVRLHPVGNNTLVGCTGDLSDFARVKETLQEIVVEDYCEDDGDNITAPEIYAFLSRILYNRRSKMDPYWTSLIVGGVSEGKTFLGIVDKLGTCFEGNFLSTGYGSHLALPILRNKWHPDLSEEEAKQLLDECMRVLFYRDCRTINKITTGKITAQGAATVTKPYVLPTVWDLKQFVKPKSGGEFAGSW
jgi:20S proteasome subunit beta 7